MRGMVRMVLAGALALLASAQWAAAQDPGFGPPRDRQWETPGGKMKLRAWPWQEFSSADLDTWLLEQGQMALPAEKVLQAPDVVLTLDKNVEGAEAYPFLARDLRRKRGHKRFSLLFACTAEDDNKRYVRLLDFTGNLVTITENRKEFWPLVGEQVKSWCEEDPGDARYAALVEAVRTEPGKGIGLDEVETVLAVMDERYDSFYHIDINIYVLLRDGRAIINPAIPISEMNAKRARELDFGEWTRWRRQGDEYEIESGNEWSRIDTRWVAEPVAEGTRLTGYFDWDDVTGDMWFGSTVLHGSYTFRENGTYASSTSSFYGNGPAMSDTMGSMYMMKSCDETGGDSSFSATGPNTNAEGILDSTGTPNWVAWGSDDKREGCGDGMGGSYHLDGYAIEFFANNGVLTRQPFYRLDDEWLVIGYQWYARDAEE